MEMKKSRNSQALRGAVLATGIAVGLGIAVTAHATQREGAAMLRSQLQELAAQGHSKIHQGVASVISVTSCADDGSPGTLRSAIELATEGSTIDLTTVGCSTITLTNGAIPIALDTLTLDGPGANALALDGNNADRLFVHYGNGDLTLAGLTVRNGRSIVGGTDITGGGCIISLGYVVLDHSVVSGCYGRGEGVYGGAIFAYNLTMLSSTLSGNTGVGKHPTNNTAVFGGGAYVNSISLFRSTVSGNGARLDAPPSHYNYQSGGGIFANLGGYVLQSTIANNYSYKNGGGISSYLGIDVVDSTFSGNNAKTGGGGGLSLRLFYAASLSNTTIANNTAAHGGGVYSHLPFATLTLQSTLIANNKAADNTDIDADLAQQILGANNLILHAGALVTLPSDTLQLDPLLQPLADNGGPTRTHALTIGSPAIDAGNNAAGLATDQRGTGFARQIGSAPDIGAFEGALPPIPPPPKPIPAPIASTRMLLAIATLLAAFGVRRLRRKRD